MQTRKVRQMNIRRRRPCVKVVLIFVLVGILFVCGMRAPAIANQKDMCAHANDYKIVCKDDYQQRRNKEYRRLMTDDFNDIFGKSMQTPIREYNLTDLSDVPAISGGLYTDRQDLDLPRDGEKYVTFAEYLDCLGRNLRVDYRKQREEELTDEEVRISFPYALSMITVDLSDLKAVMCNVSVPIRHMMYVVNSDVTSVTNFFHDVEKAFNFTQRLRIHWPGYNMGFSGAVNFAMRDAMRYPFDEVPFFFILNNDVRFPEETLPRALPEFRRVTRKDKAMLEGLRAEVAKEPSKYTPLDRRHPLLRSTDNSTLLVTSTALPDRIRYMPYEERKKIFGKHYGALFLNNKKDTAAFGMSRLAMETVGFMDENFYPAYSEDSDWRGRQMRLGFKNYNPKGVPYFIHYVNSLIKMSTRHDMRHDKATEAEVFAKSVEHFIRTIFNGYHKKKKFRNATTGARDPYPVCHELPIDAWVLDVKRRQVMMEAYAESRRFFSQAASEKKGKDTGHILGWMPQSERRRLLSAFPGDPISEAVSRAFYNCTLVRHTV